MEMAVRAATRAWRNSVELAEQAQINMELGEKYWQNARFTYALKDSYGKRASEAQLETEAAESRGDVTEARKAADRAKATERKVKEAASQVEEAVAGQKRLSEEIIGKVDAELAKQDTAIEDTSSIPVSPTIEDENETLPEEHIEENIEHEEHEVVSIADEDEEQWTPPLIEEENIEVQEEHEEETEEDTQEEALQESHALTDEDEEQWTPPLQEEENIEAHKELTLIEEVTEEEDGLENPPEETKDQDEEQWTPPLPEEENFETYEEPTIIEDGPKEEDTQEETLQESQSINDKDEEWTPPLPEEENFETYEEPTIIEDGPKEEDTQEETLQESQSINDKDEEWSPPLSEEDPVSISPSTANLILVENNKQTDLPTLPRPEMLIGEPPERPSLLKSFFGHGGVSSESKTEEKSLPSQEKEKKGEPQKEKLKIRVDDSDPNVKKMHFAKYVYPPEYLKMLLNFSNIQLADPKYQWVSIHFDKLHKRFHVFLQGNVQYIQLSRQLAYTLGFDSENVHSGQVAKYMPDISGGVRQFLVYAPNLLKIV
uniref:Uncharacterized protein n=1 Tax=Meloidogyne enterolobii TaxID=390850 RepID=A0A6V7WWL0_MELEN|nr:unnamed protein product [Meloidogyne enterolobii]